MKLLLTSQGLSPEFKDAFLELLTKPPEETQVARVITAAYADGGPKPERLEYYRKQFADYGIYHTDTLDIRGKSEEELDTIINGKDVIFVNGGNTFYLLHWVKKSGFDKVIKRHVEKGKLFIGLSAGSYIACPTIEQSAWSGKDNKIGLTDLTALNLVPFLIKAHFVEEDRQMIEDAAKTCKYPIVALNDTQAVLVDGNKCVVVGKGEKVFYNGFKEV